MGFKRILGIIVLIAGIAMLCGSYYITEQVLAGKAQVSSAQEKVNQGNSLFSLSPATKPIGQEFSNAAQNKINAGEAEIAKYEQIASWLQTGGIILSILGIALLIFGKRSKKRASK